jgi:hypothetical protein
VFSVSSLQSSPVATISVEDEDEESEKGGEDLLGDRKQFSRIKKSKLPSSDAQHRRFRLKISR